MNTPTFSVEVPELNDASIEAIAELLVRLIDDDGRIIGLDRDPESAADEIPGGKVPPGRGNEGSRMKVTT